MVEEVEAQEETIHHHHTIIIPSRPHHPTLPHNRNGDQASGQGPWEVQQLDIWLDRDRNRKEIKACGAVSTKAIDGVRPALEKGARDGEMEAVGPDRGNRHLGLEVLRIRPRDMKALVSGRPPGGNVNVVVYGVVGPGTLYHSSAFAGGATCVGNKVETGNSDHTMKAEMSKQQPTPPLAF